MPSRTVPPTPSPPLIPPLHREPPPIAGIAFALDADPYVIGRGGVWSYDRVPYKDLFIEAEARHGVSRYLLAAIAWIESGYRATSKSTAGAVGLMQVLCRPGADGKCRSKFPGIPGWEGVTEERLYKPGESVNFGAIILAWNMARFPGETLRPVAMYNSYGSRLSDRNGPFPTDPKTYAQIVVSLANRYAMQDRVITI